jgi:hypothetical protein
VKKDKIIVDRAATLPKRMRFGLYTATFKGIEGREHAHARWEIQHAGVTVGDMFDGNTYGWGRPHCSMTRLVWAGAFPKDASDPRSKNYGMTFDTGPTDANLYSGRDAYKAALAQFATNADRLMRWRREATAGRTLAIYRRRGATPF